MRAGRSGLVSVSSSRQYCSAPSVKKKFFFSTSEFFKAEMHREFFAIVHLKQAVLLCTTCQKKILFSKSEFFIQGR
jgi:hypothetical protein